jgi:hypothetical protein
LTKKRIDYQGFVEAPKAQSEKIRYGAPDGPRRTGSEKYNGHTAIEWPGLEAVAQYLAAPICLREFKSDNDLAKHFHVTRMTVYRWKQDPDVIQRVHWLSNRYRLAGDLQARINWRRIVQKAIQRAMKGDMQAIKFCEEIAWRQEKQSEKAQISPYSLEEVLASGREEHVKNAEMMTPTWIKEREKRLAMAASAGGNGTTPTTVIDVQPTKVEVTGVTPPVEAKPEPEPIQINTCDACGKPRCVHGRCEFCDVCEECEVCE